MSLIKNPRWRLAILDEMLCRKIHQKSSPPLVTKPDQKLLEDSQPEEPVSVKAERIQRSIFGATILPQNLSFENSKKLTENQVKLEDIPVIDENEFSETVFEQKLKGKRENLSKPKDDLEETYESAVVKEQNEKTIGELLWVADSYEEIPGPVFFRNAMKIFKMSTRQLTIPSLFRLVKTYALPAFKIYGPIIRLPEILGGKIVLVSRPEHINAVYEQDQRQPINSMLDSIQRSRLHLLGKTERTMYHLNETDWESLRNSVKKPLIRGPQHYVEGLESISSKFIKRIRAIKNRQDEVPDDFLLEINKWSLECLCFIMFDKQHGFLEFDGTSTSAKTSQLLYSLTKATKDIRRLENGFQIWRHVRTSSLASLSLACDVLESNISEFVAQVQLNLVRKRESTDEKSLRNLSWVESLLLQTGFPPDGIVDNILDTLLIGMNTMSVTLGFLLYHLSQNPRSQMELWKEIKLYLPEKYSRLEHDQLKSLKFLQGCLRESIRLKMPMPVLTRVLSRNILLSNYQVPKGTFMLMLPQVEGMKEENFNDPNVFLPQRWLDHDPDDSYTPLPLRNRFESCFERKMAEVSVCVCAAQIIRHFFVEFQYGDVEASTGVISFPKKPLKFTFLDRKHS